MTILTEDTVLCKACLESYKTPYSNQNLCLRTLIAYLVSTIFAYPLHKKALNSSFCERGFCQD